MTLMECVYKYFYTDDENLAAKLPGGLEPRELPQTSDKEFLTTGVVRFVGGPGGAPTHDGASKWHQCRIEFSVYSKFDVDAESALLALIEKAMSADMGAFLGGDDNGYVQVVSATSPRSFTDQHTRLAVYQADVICWLDRSTLS